MTRSQVWKWERKLIPRLKFYMNKVYSHIIYVFFFFSLKICIHIFILKPTIMSSYIKTKDIKNVFGQNQTNNVKILKKNNFFPLISIFFNRKFNCCKENWLSILYAKSPNYQNIKFTANSTQLHWNNH